MKIINKAKKILDIAEEINQEQNMRLNRFFMLHSKLHKSGIDKELRELILDMIIYYDCGGEMPTIPNWKVKSKT